MELGQILPTSKMSSAAEYEHLSDNEAIKSEDPLAHEVAALDQDEEDTKKELESLKIPENPQLEEFKAVNRLQAAQNEEVHSSEKIVPEANEEIKTEETVIVEGTASSKNNTHQLEPTEKDEFFLNENEALKDSNQLKISNDQDLLSAEAQNNEEDKPEQPETISNKLHDPLDLILQKAATINSQTKTEEEEGSAAASSSSSECSSDSDSDSSSDSDSDDSKADHEQVEDELEDPEEQQQTGPILSKNEIQDEKADELPSDYSIPSSSPIEPIGTVLSIVDKSLIIKGTLSGEYRYLSEGSVLCFSDKEVIGLLFEVFGPVSYPCYRVKFNTIEACDKFKERKGETVYYVVRGGAGFKSTDEVKGLKGSDASNWNDEEVAEEEREFSDDELEMRVKRERKLKNKGQQGKRKTNDGDGYDNTEGNTHENSADTVALSTGTQKPKAKRQRKRNNNQNQNQNQPQNFNIKSHVTDYNPLQRPSNVNSSFMNTYQPRGHREISPTNNHQQQRQFIPSFRPPAQMISNQQAQFPLMNNNIPPPMMMPPMPMPNIPVTALPMMPPMMAMPSMMANSGNTNSPGTNDVQQMQQQMMFQIQQNYMRQQIMMQQQQRMFMDQQQQHQQQQQQQQVQNQQGNQWNQGQNQQDNQDGQQK